MTEFDWTTIQPGARVRANIERDWFPAGLGTVEDVTHPGRFGPEVRVTWDSGTKLQNLTWLIPSWFKGGHIVVVEEPVNLWEELELM